MNSYHLILGMVSWAAHTVKRDFTAQSSYRTNSLSEDRQVVSPSFSLFPLEATYGEEMSNSGSSVKCLKVRRALLLCLSFHSERQELTRRLLITLKQTHKFLTNKDVCEIPYFYLATVPAMQTTPFHSKFMAE